MKYRLKRYNGYLCSLPSVKKGYITFHNNIDPDYKKAISLSLRIIKKIILLHRRYHKNNIKDYKIEIIR